MEREYNQKERKKLNLYNKFPVEDLYNDFGHIDDIFALKKAVENNFNFKIDNISNFSEGSSLNYKVSIEGKDYILKLPDRKKVRKFQSLRKNLENFFDCKLPLNYREKLVARTPEKRVYSEVSVLRNWDSSKINPVKIFKTDETNMLILEYIPGKNYRFLIDNEIFKRQHLNSFLKTVKNIREVSYDKQDKNFLHNDFYMQNFMFDENQKNCRPIDPGMLINPKINFKEADADINLFFCYTLLSKAFFNSNKTLQTRKDILKSFVNVVENNTLERMIYLNKPIPSFYLRYQQGVAKKRHSIRHFEWYNSFNKNNFQFIQNTLKKKLKIE